MFFAVEEVSWIVSDISTAANHSRDHRATRRISSTVALQCSARTQHITIDSLLVLWQDNIHPNLFMFCSYQWSVCLFVPCIWDSWWLCMHWTQTLFMVTGALVFVTGALVSEQGSICVCYVKLNVHQKYVYVWQVNCSLDVLLAKE